jgi:hypothetical protein
MDGVGRNSFNNVIFANFAGSVTTEYVTHSFDASQSWIVKHEPGG